MILLAFDTSGPYCAAALWCDGKIIHGHAEDMRKGQAERLIPILDAVLRARKINWRDLDAIGVGTGPGNFTGIRISVSAARGLAMGLNIPAIGVSIFEALRQPGHSCVAVPAPRDTAYVQMGTADPIHIPASDVDLSAIWPPAPEILVRNIAQTAALRCAQPEPAPAPLYLRPADAAPPRDAPPVILDDA
ncbi:MAG: tRNA (adenosine(37)-N6)-threonylcarbamoyltransferase complex dimerization subunit type 1 TsaB [Paracoccaceae bacterium]